MPVGTFAPSMLMYPMAHMTMLVIRSQEAATKALPYPFASTKHFYVKKAEGEASNNANLQSEYAGNLAKIKTLERHIDVWDLTSPFVIPEFVDPFALSLVEDCWGDRTLTGVNLLKNWGKLILKHCRNWQHDSFNNACTDDLTSMEWAKSLMMTSCDVLLIDRIDKKFNELDLYKQD